MQEIQTTLPVGSVLRDRYVIESLLGKGGFGAVSCVRDLRVKGNMYALKEVIEPQRKDRTRKDKNRFTFEGEILKRLDHRALPRVYRIFDDDAHERAYILMDYIEGPNLDMLRQQQPNKRFSLSQVMTLMAPVVDAVNFLHKQQPPIMHRDIKPGNIIVSSADETVLVDFDIAKEFDPDSTTTAVRRCSPGYGAPEQYGQGTSTRTDIYGLGATFYTLLTGLIPPDALHRMTLQGAKGRDPLVPIEQLVPSIPQNVAAAIQRAMALHDSDRFARIEEFWQALDTYSTAKEPAVLPARALPTDALQPPAVARAMTGNTTTIPSITKKQTPVPQPRNRKTYLIAFALLALLIAVASAAGLWSLLGTHTNVLSSTPTRIPQENVSVVAASSSDTTTAASPSPVTHGRKEPSPLSSPSSTTPPSTSSTPIPAPASPTSGPPAKPTPIPTLQPTPSPTLVPTPTPVPNPYPLLVSAYSGGIVDTTPSPNITTSMYLSSIHQNNASFSGYFTVDAPLQGNGPFTGSVGTNKYIQFTVKGYNGNAALYFWGFIQSDHSIQGQYCSLDVNGHCSANAGASGYWNVSPGLPAS